MKLLSISRMEKRGKERKSVKIFCTSIPFYSMPTDSTQLDLPSPSTSRARFSNASTMRSVSLGANAPLKAL